MTTTDARELDARVAEFVMGIHLIHDTAQVPDYYRGMGPYWAPPVGEPGFAEHWPIPHYTSNPAADYEVLRRVRETWLHNEQYLFANALAELYRPRKEGNHPILRYIPGDYSRAALAVMEGE